jgi:DNA topoisomerase-2
MIIKLKMEQEYTKLEHGDHVLKLPDTYIGSIDKQSEELWHLEDGKMVKKLITYIPGEYKIFDEIVVNAIDQYTRLKEVNDVNLFSVKTIKIWANPETGEISVYNDGEGIPIKLHEKEQIYIPELIFGNLLTSSNYKDGEKKHVGGKNGYGAKLANIFSTRFTIETLDKQTGLKYIQTFYDNMKRRDKPKITKNAGKPYTKITYLPDYPRFKVNGLTSDMMKIIEKRAYDISAWTDSTVSVYFNDTKINTKMFERYVDLFIGEKKETPRAYEQINDSWEVVATLNPNLQFEQISFVNGIYTIKGGKHVDAIVNQITKKLVDFIAKKKKITVKQSYIRENIIIFIKSTIDNPSFNSQTKEYLTTNSAKFGSKFDISQKFIDVLAKCGIIEKALELSSVKDMNALKKFDGKKNTRIRGVPKYDGANWAGTKKSEECTLILTEGDSAKTMALAGMSIVGRDRYGVFPLRGKLLNVQDEKNLKKLTDNEEINNIKKILGLQTNKEYKTLESLRYGRVMVLTDQDEDGSHIKGLVFNMFHSLWNSLFTYDGFITSMLTPVIKCSKKSQKLSFYSVKDYEKWKEKNNGGAGWTVKYYKGLGTSTPLEAKEYFKALKIVKYSAKNEDDIKAIQLAFGKNENSADMRKEWLSKYDRNLTLDYNQKLVPVKEFIDKDLIHFSTSDNIRSLPRIMDGLKPSQRKVLYCAFKRNLTKEIRVAQLAGYVSEHGAYHHGEASLNGTIVNMAQTYVGSNNINLLDPIGQFGTRVQGGKDSAQPRYIHTKLTPLTSKIFNSKDNPLYEYNDDDGLRVEPISYVPVISMLLVNGCQGIGTGWSSDIPSHNPLDLIANIKLYLADMDFNPMKPWYRGFKGEIIKMSSTTFQTRGVYTVEEDCVKITELPVDCWTDKYKEFLESIMIDSSKPNKKQFIRYYKSYCTDEDVSFEIHFPKYEIYDNNTVDQKTNMTKLEKALKLCSTISTTNMVYYNHNNEIKKTTDVLNILQEFCDVRLKFYELRRKHLIGEIHKVLDLLKIKIRFINEFISGEILISNKKKSEIIEQLKTRGYQGKPTDNAGLNDGLNADENEESSGEINYDFLLKMPIYNLTKDKIDEFMEKLAKEQSELDRLNATNNKDMWLEDLEEINVMIKAEYSKDIIKSKPKKLVKKAKK